MVQKHALRSGEWFGTDSDRIGYIRSTFSAIKKMLFETTFSGIFYTQNSIRNGFVLLCNVFMGSKNIDFRLSNAVSDVFLRAFVIFVDMICDHHKNVGFWPFFQYDQFSNTVLGYKKGSKINFDIGFKSATNKMWGVSFVTFVQK